VFNFKLIFSCYWSCSIKRLWRKCFVTLPSTFCVLWFPKSRIVVVATPLWRIVRMTLTLPKWGLGSPLGLSKIQNSIVGVKKPCLEVFFTSLERSWSLDVENGLAWAIQHKLCSKEGPRVKLAVWLPTTKSRGSTWPRVCRWSATHCWKALKENYKFALDLIPIRGLNKELWATKAPGVQIEIVSGLLLGSLGKKCHSDVGAAE
jgi:hypothetical protein